MSDVDTRMRPRSERIRPPRSEKIRLRGVSEALHSLQQDMEMASRIQRRLLPACPQVPGYDFGVVYQPAAAVGGDFYDFMPGEDDNLGFLVADCAGKGLAGALLMVEARGMIRAMASMSISPQEILTAVNRVLLHDLERGMFVSVFLAVLDAKNRTLTVANSGHMPMLIWRAASRQVVSVHPRGLVLGATTESTYGRAISEETVVLEPGDRFLLYSDGVTELMNPVRDDFGVERLMRWMEGNAALPSDVALRNLMAILEAHRAGEEQSDDITLLTGRLLP